MRNAWTPFLNAQEGRLILGGILSVTLLGGMAVTTAAAQTAAKFCWTHPSGMVKTSHGQQLTCSDWYKQGTPPASPLPERLPEPPAKPSVINSTYVVEFPPGHRIPGFSHLTQHSYEEDGKLMVDFKYKGGTQFSQLVEYRKVNYVEVMRGLRGDPPEVWISDSPEWLARLKVLVRTEEEAKELAEYVARKSALGLELIVGAWRVRKPFECPKGAGLGCQDFKELLDHNDADIVRYFYSRSESTHTYACFSDEESRFFIVDYSHYGHFGWFTQEVFEKGQSSGSGVVAEIDWLPTGFGTIREYLKQGAKPQMLGTIDSASLSYQTKYPNRAGGTTGYTLSVRWATGRYTESFSSKDEKGKPWTFDNSGICVKLN
jgi:hypothetical protein